MSKINVVCQQRASSSANKDPIRQNNECCMVGNIVSHGLHHAKGSLKVVQHGTSPIILLVRH